ncbi:glycosyltransferase [Roseateles sp.]|uniref:glycosyltransferase n=1 Tax=Roseateles sp. TaxID=1971397 RepID=UPI0031D2EBA3
MLQPSLSAPDERRSRRRVLHFVTGGFSGATQVAIDLCLAQLHSAAIEPVLVLRRKRRTENAAKLARIAALREQGLQVHVVPGWAHLATIWALRRLCEQLRPDVLMAHGFPEHLLGRRAGRLAGVPVLVQVEHNSRERYTPCKRAQARRLSAASARLVGVSEGVRRRLVDLGMPAEKTMAIPNGIRLDRFAAADERPADRREPGIVMSARFARQKDPRTLVRAMAVLRERGLRPPLYLAGGGKDAYRHGTERLTRQLGLDGQVHFLGHHGDIPGLLMNQRIFVLSTHWEGMPLALLEAMAAGCACVASLVPGVEGVLEDGRTGLLVPEADPVALAGAIERLLRDPSLAARLGAAARARAIEEHGVDLMMRRYEAMLLAL